MKNTHPEPFSPFGAALRKLREKSNKSQAEVSGAIEIEIARLNSFELGKARPAEDILLLLIQHFDLADEEAQELWRLAGYEYPTDPSQFYANDDFGASQQIPQSAVIQQDLRIVYTDMIQVMVNNYGVILNFLQGAAANNQPLAVARVGMSKEHARSVLEVLKKTLEQAETMEQQQTVPRQLSAGSSNQEA